MQGLRTQENGKFEVFWELVQETAKKQGKVFFADCGEGNDFKIEEMEGEDFCGWLIPIEEVEVFEPDWKADKVRDTWTEKMVWMEWKNVNENIIIEFNKY